MSSDFPNLLKCLAIADVDFVVVGGFAGVVHGCTYVTQDMDICCDFSVANLLNLQKALSGMHPVHRMTAKLQRLELTEESCSRYKNLYLETDAGQLDCMSIIKGLGNYLEVRQVSEVIKVEGLQLRVLSLEALIKAKRAMNRPRDKEALLQLEAIKKLKKQ